MTYVYLFSALALWSSIGDLPAAPAPRSVLAGLVGTNATHVASSSAGAAPTPLTVDQAVAIALDRHPLVRAAEFGIHAARETSGRARAAYLPTLDVTAGYARWERHAFLPDGVSSPTVASAIGPTNDWFAGLTGRFLLFDSGERAANVRAALAGERVAAADAARLRQDLALQVHEAYYGLAAALQAREVAKQEVARAEEHLRLAEARRAAGAVPGADVLRARVGLSEARLHVVSAEHLARTAAGRLNTTMGLPPETGVNLVSESTLMIPPDEVDFATGVARALVERPGLAAGRSRVELSRGTVDKAESQFGPRVSTDWRLGVRDAEWWPRDPDWSAGFTIQVPLFDGGARARTLGRARAELSQAESKVAAEELSVRRDVWDARSQLDKSSETVRSTATLVLEAEENLRVARDRYRAGAGTLIELLDADASLARAAATHVQAQMDYHAARAAFEWALGALGRPWRS